MTYTGNAETPQTIISVRYRLVQITNLTQIHKRPGGYAPDRQ